MSFLPVLFSFTLLSMMTTSSSLLARSLRYTHTACVVIVACALLSYLVSVNSVIIVEFIMVHLVTFNMLNIVLDVLELQQRCEISSLHA